MLEKSKIRRFSPLSNGFLELLIRLCELWIYMGSILQYDTRYLFPGSR